MASDENESALFAAAREPPPRALTRVSPMVRRLVAPNASPFTFNGTCTYIVGEGEVAIVDPGPGDDSHLAALLAAVEGERVDAILVTHTHRDHSVGVNKLRSATGAQVIGAAPFMPLGDGSTGLDASHDRDYSPDAILADGDRWQGHGYTIEAIATPGHCSNHLCFALLEEDALFSGDHVMAWSTSVVAAPDGSMRAYMASLDKVRGRAETIYWPGHGGPVVEPQRYLRALDPSPAAAGGLDPERARGRIPDDTGARRQGLCRPKPVLDACRGLVDPCASRGSERALHRGWSGKRRRAALPSRMRARRASARHRRATSGFDLRAATLLEPSVRQRRRSDLPLLLRGYSRAAGSVTIAGRHLFACILEDLVVIAELNRRHASRIAGVGNP